MSPRAAGFLEGRFLVMLSTLVPASRRSDWLCEWRGELWQLREVNGKSIGVGTERYSLVRGILADALWLRADHWREENQRGTARWCLQMLGTICIAASLVERVLAGSWREFSSAMSNHFLNCFLFVVFPAIFVAIASAPLRKRKCERKPLRLRGLLSSNVRWNLFLGVKVCLILIFGFLASAVITLAARKLIGHWADWVELLSTALTVILSLRWALLNQERRCQSCLQMLSQPTRVGPASRNFLDWNGTELVCSHGHGLLHVTEMEGSWCWYDLWVELDPTWHSLFHPQRCP